MLIIFLNQIPDQVGDDVIAMDDSTGDNVLAMDNSTGDNVIAGLTGNP